MAARVPEGAQLFLVNKSPGANLLPVRPGSFFARRSVHREPYADPSENCWQLWMTSRAQEPAQSALPRGRGGHPQERILVSKSRKYTSGELRYRSPVPEIHTLATTGKMPKPKGVSANAISNSRINRRAE